MPKKLFCLYRVGHISSFLSLRGIIFQIITALNKFDNTMYFKLEILLILFEITVSKDSIINFVR